MLTIPYDTSDFPSTMPALCHGRHTLSVSWQDLIWSAVSVGKSGIDDMLAHGPHSIDEIRFRNYLMWANLWESDGYIHRSPAYDDLDPTEKGAISYFLGMALAKLFALKLFNAPWMVHLDRLVDRHTVLLSGRSRPDLAGQDVSGRWILLEGKGRTGNFDKLALLKAKQQVQQVSHIDGHKPYLRVGAEMYFDEHMAVSLVDPDESLADSVDLQIGSDVLQEVYYKRFMPLLETRERTQSIRDIDYAFVDYNLLGVSIGVRTELPQIAHTETLAGILQIGPQEERDEIHQSGRWLYQTYPDGIAVGIDNRWSKEAMSRYPFQRPKGGD